jgi:hypothetical protein
MENCVGDKIKNVVNKEKYNLISILSSDMLDTDFGLDPNLTFISFLNLIERMRNKKIGMGWNGLDKKGRSVSRITLLWRCLLELT